VLGLGEDDPIHREVLRRGFCVWYNRQVAKKTQIKRQGDILKEAPVQDMRSLPVMAEERLQVPEPALEQSLEMAPEDDLCVRCRQPFIDSS
jgi:hypothetical protein